jgi:hypothetical protein
LRPTLQKQIMATEWKCRNCIRVFETRGRRDAHHRSKHQGLSNVTEGELQRSEDGRFVCQCGKTYQQVQALKRHQKACAIATDVLEAFVLEEESTRPRLHMINVSITS